MDYLTDRCGDEQTLPALKNLLPYDPRSSLQKPGFPPRLIIISKVIHTCISNLVRCAHN